MLSDLNGFGFGMPKDAPEGYKLFPQDTRIDLITNVINE